MITEIIYKDNIPKFVGDEGKYGTLIVKGNFQPIEILVGLDSTPPREDAIKKVKQILRDESESFNTTSATCLKFINKK